MKRKDKLVNDADTGQQTFLTDFPALLIDLVEFENAQERSQSRRSFENP